MIASRSVTLELKRLFQQSGHYLFGLVGSLALGFVSFPIFTRAFSVADYGLIDLTQKILLLLTATTKLGLQNSALRFFDRRAFEADSEAAKRYYSTMFFGVAGAGAFGALALFVAAPHLPAWAADAKLSAVLSLGAVLIFFRATQSMLWSFLRIEERTKLFNVTTAGMKAGTIAAICLLFPILGASVTTYYSGTILVEGAMAITLTALLLRRSLLSLAHFDWALVRSCCSFGFPLIALELAGITLDSGDRALVRHYLGDVALGQYSVAYGLSTYVNTLLITPLNLAIIPIYMRLWKSEGAAKTSEFLSFGLDILLLAAAGVFAVVTVSARDGIYLLASQKYRGTEVLIPTVTAGLLIWTTYAFLNAGLMIHKKTVKLAGVLVCSAVVNISLNCLLLPRIGLRGAAIATLIGYTFCILLLAAVTWKVLPLSIRVRSLSGYLLSSAVACVIVSQIELNNTLLNLAVKPCLAALLYAFSVYVIDRDKRELVAQIWRKVQGRLQVGSAVAA